MTRIGNAHYYVGLDPDRNLTDEEKNTASTIQPGNGPQTVIPGFLHRGDKSRRKILEKNAQAAPKNKTDNSAECATELIAGGNILLPVTHLGQIVTLIQDIRIEAQAPDSFLSVAFPEGLHSLEEALQAEPFLAEAERRILTLSKPPLTQKECDDVSEKLKKACLDATRVGENAPNESDYKYLCLALFFLLEPHRKITAADIHKRYAGLSDQQGINYEQLANNLNGRRDLLNLLYQTRMPEGVPEFRRPMEEDIDLSDPQTLLNEMKEDNRERVLYFNGLLP